MVWNPDFFAALRRMKARAAIAPIARGPDIAPAPATAPAPAIAVSPGSIGPAGITLIKQFEGCARRRGDGWFDAYPDPGTGGAPWTIGWGATGPGIVQGTVWSGAQCDARLEADLIRLHKAGHWAEAAAEFGKWVHAGGRRLPGLVRRRAAEAKLYKGGMAA